MMEIALRFLLEVLFFYVSPYAVFTPVTTR